MHHQPSNPGASPIPVVLCIVLTCTALIQPGCSSEEFVSPTSSSTPRPSPATTSSPVLIATATHLPRSTPTATETPVPPTHTTTATSLPSPTRSPSLATATPSSTIAAVGGQFDPVPPDGRVFATLEEFWDGVAEWLLESADVGLPIGESDTVYRGHGELWSYLHASYESAGVVDSCGAPAPFPGCVTRWVSHDGGLHFQLENPVCLFPCSTCPCTPSDHTQQQQYPRVFFDSDRAYMVYEWGAGTYLRTSSDGLVWSSEAHVPGTGAWHIDQGECTESESIGEHPHIFSELEFDCLVGAPPGVYVEGDSLYVFVGLGRAPGHMGCLVGSKYGGAAAMRKCRSNPLFGAERGYGPVESLGPEANPYFEFRTISSAEIISSGTHYYMTYEGVRGPSDPTVVDDQFALGLARTTSSAIDGPWEKYAGNPIIVDLPANVGVGHADLVQIGPAVYLYTATSDGTRGRYALVHR